MQQTVPIGPGGLKHKKPAQVNLAGFLCFNPQLCCASCGVGGIRTLVQTRNTTAFYTLSFLLVFVTTPGNNTQTCPKSPFWFQSSIKTPKLLGLLLRCPLINCRKPRPLRDILLSDLVGRGIILL